VSDRVVLSLSAILLLLSAAAWRSLPDGRLHVRFMDVGQGDAVFIRTPAGRQILVDGGPSPSTLLEQVGRSMPFWDHHLDLVILSHPDEDLLAGLIPVLERYRVDGVIVGQARCNSPLCARWQEVLEDSGAHVWRGEAGLQMGLDEGLLLTVLHPGPGFSGTLNDRSLVLRLDYGEVCFLLTGDAGPGVEERLVAQGAWLECSVLKAAHHGDGAATTEIFLAAVDPEEVIIPVGEGDRMRRPHWDLLERLEGLGVHRTDEHGTVEIVSDGRTYRIVRER
jgi:competence protein ComEC